MKNFKSTSEKIASENYPYGFKLRTTMYDYLEFKYGKGFRHCSQTINPKTGQLNNPKKSTYYHAMVLFTDENNHVKSTVLDFNGAKEINSGCLFMAEHFDLFTAEQINYIYGLIVTMLKVEVQAICTYCGADPKQVIPIIEPVMKTALRGFKECGNVFPDIKVDIEALDGCKVPDYNPFKVTTYGG